MAAPENKENIEQQLAKPMQLPRPDQSAIMGAEGAAQLPARPRLPGEGREAGTPDEKVSNKVLNPENLARSSESKPQSPDAREHPPQADLKDKLLQHRIQELEVLVARSEQERKALLSTMVLGENPDKEIVKLTLSLIHLGDNGVLIDQLASGNINPEALAKHILSCIQQQRSFDCSAKELAMLDSLEFQIMRVLQHINPNIRIQQQQQQVQDDMGPDDDAGSAGPEKVEDDREAGFEGIEDADVDTDTSYSPRSKKGKARSRSRARDRRSRFKKWLAMMMRIFRGQTLVMRGTAMPKTSARAEVRDRRFIKTVRIFGRVVDIQSRNGLEGVKIVSNTLGSVLTGPDGSFSFENVASGTSYSLAPLKSGCIFTPQSVNDVALDYREHNFFVVPE